MALILPDKWIWDFWLAREGDVWHVFFLQADRALRNPDLRHWNSSIGHAVSRNLTDWDYRGTVLQPSLEPGFDDATTWTGSIVNHGNEWLLFYTGNAKADNAKVQRIGLARSPDLQNWTRDPAGAIIDNLPAPYENQHYVERWHDRSLRDPDVSADPLRGGWRMYFSARVTDRDADSAGCIGMAWSRDLTHWEVLPPAVSPGIAGELEVPQFLHIEGRYYLLFCTGSNRIGASFAGKHPQAAIQSGTHYFIADHPDGPWKLGSGMFFAGDERWSRYAGKLVNDGADWSFLAFMNQGPDGAFIGGLGDPIPVRIGAGGELRLERPVGAFPELRPAAENNAYKEAAHG